MPFAIPRKPVAPKGVQQRQVKSKVKEAAAAVPRSPPLSARRVRGTSVTNTGRRSVAPSSVGAIPTHGTDDAERDHTAPPQYLATASPPPSRGATDVVTSGRLNGTLSGANATITQHLSHIGTTGACQPLPTQQPHQQQQQALPTYLVGNAVLNPYVPVSPSVQQAVRGVSTLGELPVAATRPRIGPHFLDSEDELHPFAKPSDYARVDARSFARSGEADANGGPRSPSPHSLRFSTPTPADGFDAPHGSNTQDLTDGVPEYHGVPLVPSPAADTTPAAPLVRVTRITGGRRGRRGSTRQGVEALRVLYGTTKESVLLSFTPRRSREDANSNGDYRPGLERTAANILPELHTAEARARELAAVRRHIDWDVTIPTADTMPPPAIAFLDGTGAPVPHLSSMVLVLDAATQVLTREEKTASTALTAGGVSSSSSQRRAPGGEAADLQPSTVGTIVSFDDGTHRVHRLVGLLGGLAERVGLERVMEYQVQTQVEDLFLAPPFVDSNNGDLVLKMNASLQGTIKMTILGFDCASVDVATGTVQQSCNTLSCVIKVKYSGDPSKRTQQQKRESVLGGLGTMSGAAADTVELSLGAATAAAATAGGGMVLRTGTGEAPFVFPSTNPHELLYNECDMTTRMYLIRRLNTMQAEEAARRDKAADEQQRRSQRKPLGKEEEGKDALADFSTDVLVEVMPDSTATPARRESAEHSTSSGTAATQQEAERPSQPLPPRSMGTSEPGDEDLYPGEQDLRLSLGSHIMYSPTGSLQTPLHHFRVTIWQDYIEKLYRDEDRDLYNPKCRASVKESARRELRSVLSLRSKGDGHSHYQALSTSRAKRSTPPASASIPLSAMDGASVAQATTEQSLRMVRRLILCLMLEESRGSPQLHSDTLELCGHLAHNSLLRTMAATSGTPEGLQRAATAVLSGEYGVNGAVALRHSFGVGNGVPACGEDGPAGLRSKEMGNMRLLVDSLTVAMLGTALIGAFKDSVLYATQRVHALCLVEGDTTRTVCAAQRDLAEMLMSYGDYSAAIKISDDVLMLTEQLYEVDSQELVEAELLVVLSHLIAGAADQQVRELIMKLYERQHSQRSTLAPALTAQIKLMLAYARLVLDPSVADQVGLTNASTVAELGEVVTLLRSDGCTSPSFTSPLTSRPSTAPGITYGIGNASPDSCSTRLLPGTEKRLRWNLLSLTGMLLINNGKPREGIQVLETVIQELVMTPSTATEQRHKSLVLSLVWVGVVIWKMWLRPCKRDEMRPLLKKVIQRLTQTMGPLHPVSASANMMHAYIIRDDPRSNAFNIAMRSFTVLQLSTSSRSAYMLVACRICSEMSILTRHWRSALEHASAALVIAQTNSLRKDQMSMHEQALISALLRTPATAAVRVDIPLLLQKLQERIVNAEAGYGIHSQQLMVPLVNLAEIYYLQQNYVDALSCLQRATRVADPKGVLFVTTAVLKPASQLPSQELVEQRDQMTMGVMQSARAVLTLAQMLFAMAAVLEAHAVPSDALDCYGRALALLECIRAEGCLAAARVCGAMARVLYTSGDYGDALGWARRAERVVREHYKDWPADVHASRSLVSIVEQRISDVEGTHVTVNPHNPCRDYVELL